MFLRPDEFKFTDEELQQYDAQALTDLLQERASDIYARKEAELGEPLMRELERVMMLRVVDEYWMDNIDAMQELRQGIGLRAYGQNDPVVAYKKEGYEMFESMIAAIQAETIRRIFLARVQVGATTVKRERVAKVTGESAGSDGTVQEAARQEGPEGGPQRPLSLWQRQEVQEVLRHARGRVKAVYGVSKSGMWLRWRLTGKRLRPLDTKPPCRFAAQRF